MHGFGYKEKVEIDHRKFQVHTGCIPEKQRIVTEVFEEGRYLFGEFQSYSVRENKNELRNESYMKAVAYDLHSSAIDELTVLFHAHYKLKSINDYLAHYRLGKVFLSKNFFNEAVENFRQVVTQKEDFMRGYKLLGFTYLKSERYRQAMATFERALKKQADFPDLLNGLGLAHTYAGNFETARNYFHHALEINPEFVEIHFNLGVILFLATLKENPNEENIVIPVRIVRSIREIKELDFYQGRYWQAQFNELLEVLKNKDPEQIGRMLKDLQIKMALKDDDVAQAMDFFFIKFMYGGKELKEEEIAYYEKKIREEAEKHQGFADYWNELGTLHLIQCRDYFLKALDEIGQAVKVNPHYAEANQTLELMKRSKKGFLILLRAILK